MTAAVRQRRLGPEESGSDLIRGVDGLEEEEKKPNLEADLGVELVLCCCWSNCFGGGSRSRGMDVQKALRHPNTIFAAASFSLHN